MNSEIDSLKTKTLEEVKVLDLQIAALKEQIKQKQTSCDAICSEKKQKSAYTIQAFEYLNLVNSDAYWQDIIFNDIDEYLTSLRQGKKRMLHALDTQDED